MSTRVVAYARVSTVQQGESGLGLDAQIAKMQAYAALYGLEIVETITDVASASSLDREGVQRALDMVASGQVDGMLIAKLDRLTRSVVDLGNMIAGVFARGQLHSVEDRIDTSTAAGRLILNVLMSVSQWEREVISERTTAALAQKRTRGERLGRPTFGAKASEQAIIAQIRSLAADPRNTQRQIAEAVGVSQAKVSRILSRAA